MTPPHIQVNATGTTRVRPPKLILHVDVVLDRAGSEARWVVLPGTPSETSAGTGPRRVAAFYAYELTGSRGRAGAVTAIGDTDAIAVRLPPEGVLRLAGLPLSFWGEAPAALELEVVAAAELLVYGRALEDLLERPVTSDPGADVDASPLAGQMAAVAAVDTHGGEPLELTLATPESLRVVVGELSSEP